MIKDTISVQHLFDGGQGSIVVCAPSHLAPISLIKENISDLLHIGVINTETKLLPGNGSLVFRNCIVKSGTLLHLLSGLDRPTTGSLYYDGRDIYGMRDRELSAFRRRRIGFVFQNFNLLPRANALKNVMIPLMYSEHKRKDQKERAMEMLAMVGMEERADHRPNELSGGQKQRVAIARAMINNPAIILADEPTGALDSKTGHMVMDLFHKLHEEQGKTIVLITHSQELASETQRIVTLLDGEIVADKGGAR